MNNHALVAVALSPILAYSVSGGGPGAAFVCADIALVLAFAGHRRGLDVRVPVGFALILATGFLSFLLVPDADRVVDAAVHQSAASWLAYGALMNRPWLTARFVRGARPIGPDSSSGRAHRFVAAVWALALGWISAASLLEFDAVARWAPLLAAAILTLLLLGPWWDPRRPAHQVAADSGY